MKHTSNMIYLESDESRELYLYAVNTCELYTMYIVPVVRNLARKYSKGIFDNEKAVDAFYPVATEAARMYCHEFCGREGFTTVFDVTARYTVAADMVARYMENIIANDM